MQLVVQYLTQAAIKLLRQDMMGFWDGSGISWTICKQSTPCSKQITTPASHHPLFYRPNALPDAQPMVSEHRRHKIETGATRAPTHLLHLSVCLSVCLSARPPACPSVRLSLCLSVCLLVMTVSPAKISELTEMPFFR